MSANNNVIGFPGPKTPDPDDQEFWIDPDVFMEEDPFAGVNDISLQGGHVSKHIWVTFQREGIHCYPEALEDPNLEDVKFLGYPHRHIFHFKVTVPVVHSNRDIEFIQFKRWCESLYQGGALDLNSKSCEMIAEELGEEVLARYPSVDYVEVDVSEDGENGAHVLLSRPIAQTVTAW